MANMTNFKINTVFFKQFPKSNFRAFYINTEYNYDFLLVIVLRMQVLQ